MKKSFFLLLSIVFFSTNFLIAQNQTVSGVVRDNETNITIPAVSVLIKNSNQGTNTDDRGRFQITPGSKFPVVLIFSSTGYETKEITVNKPGAINDVIFASRSTLGEEVVVNASRMAQRKLTAPVTIEQLSKKDIQQSPQLNYIDAIQGLRGVDVTVSSMGFKSITTRGFNTSGNTNFTQIVDGMDNQAPGLNFPLGNVISVCP